jgi:hypothetical protein
VTREGIGPPQCLTQIDAPDEDVGVNDDDDITGLCLSCSTVFYCRQCEKTGNAVAACN